MRRVLAVVFALALLAASAAPAAAGGWVNGNAGVGGDSMAQVTLLHSSYAGGLAKLEFDYNDNTGDVLRFRCTNNSDYILHGEVWLVPPEQTGSLVWQGDCPAHTVQTLPVSKFNLAWDTVNGGLIMGNYQIRTRWPG